MLEKQIKRHRRHKRVRAKIFGTKERPRLCVFKSNKHIYAQLVDDDKGRTLVGASDLELKKPKTPPQRGEARSMKLSGKNQRPKTDVAKEIGKLIAQKAQDLKIEEVVFDRGGYQYHGRVKALADGAREGGLKF